MKLQVYAVRDNAVAAFLPPFYARAKGEAVRSFQAACIGDGPFAKNVKDFDMYFIGYFDDNAGMLQPDQVEMICSGLQVVGPDFAG